MSVSHSIQVAIGQLHPHPANVRRHSKRQIAQIVRSILAFGFTAPIVADENGCILAGYGRWLAGKQIGLTHVPVVVLSGLSDVERRAYILADNKLVENAGWDRAGLAIELHQLAPLLAEASLDIGLTGFESPEIDALMGEVAKSERNRAGKTTEIAVESISRHGDVWLLDQHRLYCGDAQNDADATIRYWQNFTKGHAILQATGQTFAAVAAARCK